MRVCVGGGVQHRQLGPMPGPRSFHLQLGLQLQQQQIGKRGFEWGSVMRVCAQGGGWGGVGVCVWGGGVRSLRGGGGWVGTDPGGGGGEQEGGVNAGPQAAAARARRRGGVLGSQRKGSGSSQGRAAGSTV
jgi:hypothetical protein